MIHSETPRSISKSEFDKVSSNYLSSGRSNESWQIDSISYNPAQLIAFISMKNAFLVESDQKKWHLPIFPIYEFTSQLQIIYLHLWAQLEKKTKEIWMIETNIRAIRPILSRDSIKVVVNKSRIRKTDKGIYCICDHIITDHDDGLINIKIKSFLENSN